MTIRWVAISPFPLLADSDIPRRQPSPEGLTRAGMRVAYG